MTRTLTRRGFLQAAASTAALTLLNLRFSGAAESALPDLSYRGVEDVYPKQWTWDSISQAHCSWNVYVKDGVVLREEQVAAYPRTNAQVPDFNPRGFQKGACYSQLMYDVGRLQYPLKRAGKRGAGKWQRISWDQALREIADQTIDVLRSIGPAGIIWDFGTQHAHGCHGIGLHRTGAILDTPSST